MVFLESMFLINHFIIDWIVSINFIKVQRGSPVKNIYHAVIESELKKKKLETNLVMVKQYIILYSTKTWNSITVFSISYTLHANTKSLNHCFVAIRVWPFTDCSTIFFVNSEVFSNFLGFGPNFNAPNHQIQTQWMISLL